MQGNRMTNKARVLFVDDEQRVLNSMRGMFRRDFDLFLASEGATAIKIAAETPIDVIVADQRMPGMTGIEVLGKVKEMSPDTVRILLTGYADPSAVEGSINVGEVFRFLGKPCSPKLLRETLQLAINATRTAQAAAQSSPEPDRPPRPPQEPAGHRVTDMNLAPSGPGSPGPGDNTAARQPSAGPGNGELLSRLTSIGEVAFAWDSYKRRSEPETDITAQAASTRELGVVLYTVDSVFAETAIRALSGRRSTTLATSLIKVMRALEKTQPGVLVTDISTNGPRLQKIVSALKQLRPDLVTIVVSNTTDTTDMVSLINHGQIFRYLQKPVQPQSFVTAVDAAAAKSLQLKINPAAAGRHAVIPATPNASAADTLRSALRGNDRL